MYNVTSFAQISFSLSPVLIKLRTHYIESILIIEKALQDLAFPWDFHEPHLLIYICYSFYVTVGICNDLAVHENAETDVLS